MKKSHLKSIIAEVIGQLHEQSSHEHSFDTIVEVDQLKALLRSKKFQPATIERMRSKLLAKGDQPGRVYFGAEDGQEVSVDVSFEYEYEDNRFDHEFGTHDPGSGYVQTGDAVLTVTSKEPFYATDANGDDTKRVLFKMGDNVPLSVLTKAGAARLATAIEEELGKLTDGSYYEPDLDSYRDEQD